MAVSLGDAILIFKRDQIDTRSRSLRLRSNEHWHQEWRQTDCYIFFLCSFQQAGDPYQNHGADKRDND
jgi:hypothetical protein